MTKLTKTIFICIAILTFPILYIGCDNSGIVVHSPSAVFDHGNYPNLPDDEHATYELFVSFSSGANGQGPKTYCSMGKFNIATTGQAVDLSGSPIKFKFDFSPDMSKAVDAIITIEPYPDNDTVPNGPVFMGGGKALVNTVYEFDFTMNFWGGLGQIADQFRTDNAQFILASPSAGYPSAQFTRGVWFTPDSTGTNPGITCASLPDSLKWTYHAYLIDTRDTVNGIYNIGKFQDPNAADGLGSCFGNGNAWNKPGQDWIQSNCPGGGVHDIDGTFPYSLNNGNYKLLVTLEPKSRTLKTPFFFRVFYGPIPAGTGFNIPLTLQNVTIGNMPGGDITINSNDEK